MLIFYVVYTVKLLITITSFKIYSNLEDISQYITTIKLKSVKGINEEILNSNDLKSTIYALSSCNNINESSGISVFRISGIHSKFILKILKDRNFYILYNKITFINDKLNNLIKDTIIRDDTIIDSKKYNFKKTNKVILKSLKYSILKLYLVLMNMIINPIESRKVILNDIFNPINGIYIDSVINIYFQKPSSFTGQDMVEIHTHGTEKIRLALLDSLSSFNTILKNFNNMNKLSSEIFELEIPNRSEYDLDILTYQIRPSSKGEFTLRGFITGKRKFSEIVQLISIYNNLNLSQVEENKNNSYIYQDIPIKEWIDKLINISSSIDTILSNPDDYISTDELIYKCYSDLEKIKLKMNYWLKKLESINLSNNISLNDNYNICIVGEENAGKSSLFNILLGRNDAIISNIGGTTREGITDTISLSKRMESIKRKINIIDTAGIKFGDTDEITKMSISIAIKKIKNSNMLIIVLNGEKLQQGYNILNIIEWLNKILEKVSRDKKLILIPIINMYDLINKLEINEILNKVNTLVNAKFDKDLLILTPFSISCKSYFGIDNLSEIIESNIHKITNSEKCEKRQNNLIIPKSIALELIDIGNKLSTVYTYLERWIVESSKDYTKLTSEILLQDIDKVVKLLNSIIINGDNTKINQSIKDEIISRMCIGK